MTFSCLIRTRSCLQTEFLFFSFYILIELMACSNITKTAVPSVMKYDWEQHCSHFCNAKRKCSLVTLHIDGPQPTYGKEKLDAYPACAYPLHQIGRRLVANTMSNVMPDGVFEMMWDEDGEHRARLVRNAALDVSSDVMSIVVRGVAPNVAPNTTVDVASDVLLNVGYVVPDAASDFAVNAADTL